MIGYAVLFSFFCQVDLLSCYSPKFFIEILQTELSRVFLVIWSSSYKTQSLAEKTKPGQKRIAGARHGYGQMDTGPSRDEDALWNFTRRTPIKGRPGELEAEFRAHNGTNTQATSQFFTCFSRWCFSMGNPIWDGVGGLSWFDWFDLIAQWYVINIDAESD